jgi:hypothetical protein
MLPASAPGIRALADTGPEIPSLPSPGPAFRGFRPAELGRRSTVQNKSW